MSTPQPVSVFVGWHRPHAGSRWRPLTRAATQRLASDLLYRAVLSGSGDFCVLRDGIDPNVRPRSR
jgi:hypothetical protein